MQLRIYAIDYFIFKNIDNYLVESIVLYLVKIKAYNKGYSRDYRQYYISGFKRQGVSL